MTKLLLAAIAAFSFLASPVLASPWDGQAPSYYNGYKGDFQLQGR